jgi:hypothetical protein
MLLPSAAVVACCCRGWNRAILLLHGLSIMAGLALDFGVPFGKKYKIINIVFIYLFIY